MQQHISIDMLAKLSPEAKQRLREWWQTSEGDKFFDLLERWCLCYDGSRDMVVSTGLSKHDKQVCLPLLSIGQCIELLAGQVRSELRICVNPKDTRTYLYDGEDYTTDNAELIRALWDAAKEVLEAGDCPEWKEEKP